MKAKIRYISDRKSIKDRYEDVETLDDLLAISDKEDYYLIISRGSRNNISQDILIEIIDSYID